MDLILLVLAIAVVGCIVYVIESKIPMDPLFRLLIRVVVVIAIVFWLLDRFKGTIPNVLN